MIILYPTETLYALGVNALDKSELAKLYELKGRHKEKAVSWLVPNVDDIERYAFWTPTARRIAEAFLPGAVTLVLLARPEISLAITGVDHTLGFRVSSDSAAAALVGECGYPLTATSANISGESTLTNPTEILKQFGVKASLIDRVIDDGTRNGTPSTVVRCIGTEATILREGAHIEQIRALIASV